MKLGHSQLLCEFSENTKKKRTTNQWENDVNVNVKGTKTLHG